VEQTSYGNNAVRRIKGTQNMTVHKSVTNEHTNICLVIYCNNVSVLRCLPKHYKSKKWWNDIWEVLSF